MWKKFLRLHSVKGGHSQQQAVKESVKVRVYNRRLDMSMIQTEDKRPLLGDEKAPSVKTPKGN